MNNPPIDQEKVVRITKLSFCFKGFVVSFKLRELNDFTDGYVLGFDDLFGGVRSEFGIGSVVDNEAELGGGRIVNRVRERDSESVGTRLWWDFLESEVEVDEVVLWEQLGFLEFGLGFFPFEEGAHCLLYGGTADLGGGGWRRLHWGARGSNFKEEQRGD